MCGIVAYVGERECAGILVDGLRKLEYRGYDSAGLALHTGRGVEIVRAVGKLVNLDNALAKTPLAGKTGIGHTRWATHGRPNEVNAHPHVAGKVAVVHNGIIENHGILRQELEAKKIRFSSDTDTEIVAHLIQEAMSEGAPSLEEAVRKALRRVKGAYAIAVVSGDAPDDIIVAKDSSPLVLGVGKGEMLAASDIPALLEHTREVIFLEDGEMALLRKTGPVISKIDGTPVTRAAKHIEWSASQAEKGGYKHFMLKEILEQPRAIEDTVRGRINVSEADVVPEEIGVTPALAKSITRVYFVACGTSAHAAMAGRYWVEQLARLPATVEIGSEVRYREPVFSPTDLVVAVSQSGETADTLAAVKAAKAQGAHVLAVANVLDSALPRAADGALYTHAGPEIGVASTKCFTTQLAALLMLAVYLGRRRGTLSQAEGHRVLGGLLKAAHDMRDVLEQKDKIQHIAKKYSRSRDMLFLGRGTGFPIALEGALKLKEISYIHAEGYAAGEMKHGPIALIDEEMPVVVLCPKDAHYEKTVSNLEEVRAREGIVIAVCTKGDTEIPRLVTPSISQIPVAGSRSQRQPFAISEPDVIEIPEVEPEVLPLLTVVPLQLLSYYIADFKGTDVDQPRNLAKTVTVE
ncbi:glutamine--fructose-6-phosphate transaminase (isomerizing) [Pendulispora albinea]|uniref:Glutamine--fructose-6-phosphate aminotransferase [isomerizing] n=1 Tax=Pendulispora albinea TaxID=2741071 RepID=A0ABZ2LSF3_9BACT